MVIAVRWVIFRPIKFKFHLVEHQNGRIISFICQRLDFLLLHFTANEISTKYHNKKKLFLSETLNLFFIWKTKLQADTFPLLHFYETVGTMIVRNYKLTAPTYRQIGSNFTSVCKIFIIRKLLGSLHRITKTTLV